MESAIKLKQVFDDCEKLGMDDLSIIVHWCKHNRTATELIARLAPLAKRDNDEQKYALKEASVWAPLIPNIKITVEDVSDHNESTVLRIYSLMLHVAVGTPAEEFKSHCTDLYNWTLSYLPTVSLLCDNFYKPTSDWLKKLGISWPK